MMKTRPHFTFETALYLFIFILAAAFRFYELGAHPLAPSEAQAALGVWRFIQAEAVTPAPTSAAYFFFGYFAQLLFGASDATARAMPALAGVALVALPWLFRPQLGRGGALVASGLLALSSTLLAASRSADGAIFAVLGVGAGVAFLAQAASTRQPLWLVFSGIAWGLGLTAGPLFWTGALALSLTGLTLWFSKPELAPALTDVTQTLRERWQWWLLPLVASIVIISTVGLLYLRGFGDWLQGSGAWFTGLISSGLLSPILIPSFLLAYEPLLLGLAMLGVTRAFALGHRWAQALTWFSLFALLISIIYGDRSFVQLIWVAAPLALLGGWALAEALSDVWQQSEVLLAALQAAITGILLIFANLQFTMYVNSIKDHGGQPPDSLIGTLPVPAFFQLSIVVVVLVLIGVVAYLLAMGWGVRGVLMGLLTSLTAAALCLNFTAAWGLTQLRPTSAAELWWSQPTADSVRYLRSSLSATSNFAVGNDHDVAVTVLAPPGSVFDAQGLIAWELRAFPNVQFVDRLDPQMESAVVLAPFSLSEPTLGSSYVGQDFIWHESWRPTLNWNQWLVWLVFRTAPDLKTERVILWVRQDIQQLQGTGVSVP